jgi:hypothetical protein
MNVDRLATPSGGLVSVLILLPNLLWMLFPPREKAQGDARTSGGLCMVMEVLEWVGRIVTLLIPFFYGIEVQGTRQVIALVLMSLAVLLYYACWARYFSRGRRYALLFEPLLGIPLPMAISPIVCFFAASVLFGSWYLALATLVLAVGHLWISLEDSREVLGRA